MPPPNTDDATEEGGNADRRLTWFARAQGQDVGKGKRRPEPTTIPIPGQTPTGPAWAPAGPAIVRNGQAFGDPTVSGRVLDLVVGPLSERAYAATSDGGVWRYTEDIALDPPTAGWVPLHDGVRSPDATTVGANALATGAIAVVWGASPAQDRLFIGTGEVHPRDPSSPTDTPSTYSKYPGIGIRVSTGEPGSAGVTQEATHLDGEGIFRLLVEPGNAEVVWAGTSDGLFRRPASGNRTNWERITDASFPGPNWAVTDLAATGSGTSLVLWAAFWHRGVWRLAGGSWAQVPGLPAPTATAPGNLALAASPQAANANAVYALDELGTVHRFDGTRFQLVRNTPPRLVNGQGNYDLCVAVHPTNPDHVLLGGDAARNPGNATESPEWEAMLFGRAVTTSGPGWDYAFNGPDSARNDHHREPSYLGQGVHADVHRIAFGLQADGSTPDANEVWVGCDGGVFRSSSGPSRGRFRSLNDGLASIQFNHLAAHPVAESVVYAGSQDNGVIRRSGDAVWFETRKGDGGGVAIDPENPSTTAIQYVRDDVLTSATGGVDGWDYRPVPVSTATDGSGNRRERPEFYAPLRFTPAGSNPKLLLYPTHRVWATDDLGSTWVTLPSATTPTNAQFNQDRLDSSRSSVTALVPSSATRIHASTRSHVYRITRTAAPTVAAPLGTWTGPAALPTTGLPATRRITSVAVLSASGPESLYAGLGGTGSGVDHVWWFDDGGAGQWRPTGLGGSGGVAFDAPVTSLAVDPTDATVVFAGTPLGVWRGTRSGTGAASTWAWVNLSNDLPEAGVLDLGVQVYGIAPNEHRMLRVATHGRGLWELQVGRATTPDPDVHMRMNNADAGRRHVSMRSVVDPERVAAGTTTWLDSPDIGLRRPSLPLTPTPFLASPTPAPTAPPPFDRNLANRTLDTQTWNGVAGRRPVRFLQRNIARRGVAIGIDGDFGGGTERAVQTLQRRYRMPPSGVADAATWLAICGAPDLGTDPMVARQFAEDLRPDLDEATGAVLADATGTNRLFAQVHARGTRVQAAGDVRVAGLVAPLTGSPLVPPQLPNGWAAKVRSGDTTDWVGASGWRLLGYRSPEADLSDLLPQVVEWDLDLAALGFSAGDELLVLVAVHTADQALTTGDRVARSVVQSLPAVAARRLRARAVLPVPPP